MLRKYIVAIAIIVLGTSTNTAAAAKEETQWVEGKAYAKPTESKTTKPLPALPVKPEVLLLEKIADRLVYINNISWERQTNITSKNIMVMQPEPQGYSKKYTSNEETYKSKIAYTKKLKMMHESIKDTKEEVRIIIEKVKTGKEKDLLKAFSDIYSAIVLRTKNLDEQGNNISDEIGNQNRRIEAYNASLGAKVRGGVEGLKNRISGKN